MIARCSAMHERAKADAELTRYLVLHGANPLARNSDGKTPAELKTNQSLTDVEQREHMS